MTRLAKMLAELGGQKTSLRSDAEVAFMWQVKHTTDIADPLPAHQFDLVRKWKFDFAWPDVHIAVEIEGGIWRGRGRGSQTSANTGGAHSHPLNILRDIEKYNAAARAGWRIIRFTPDMVKKGEAIAFLATVGLPKKKPLAA